MVSFGPMTLTLCPSPYKSCLCHCSNMVYGNCFIFSRQIKLTWYLCTLWIFWHCDFWSWKCDIHLENIFCDIAQKKSKWQQIHILWAYQPNMGHAWRSHFDLLTFSIDIMTFTLKILSGPLLDLETIHGNYFTLHPDMGFLHCGVILTFWPLTLKLWLPWKSCLGDNSKTIHGIFNIFSEQINIMWYLCIIGIFLCFELQPWNYDLHILSRSLLENYKW